MMSSQKRERCAITVEQAKMYSATKSLSETASKEFWLMRAKFINFAVIVRSMGKSVPARAQLPRGITSVRRKQSAKRSMSRRNISL